MARMSLLLLAIAFVACGKRDPELTSKIEALAPADGTPAWYAITVKDQIVVRRGPGSDDIRVDVVYAADWRAYQSDDIERPGANSHTVALYSHARGSFEKLESGKWREAIERAYEQRDKRYVR